MYRTIIITIIALLLIAYVQGKEKKIQEPRRSDKYITDYQDVINEVQKLPDNLAMIMLVNPDEKKCENCTRARELYSNFTQLTQKLVYSFVIDCKEIWKKAYQRSHLPACDPAQSEKLPIIQFLVPPKEEYNPLSKKRLHARDVPYKDELETQMLLAHAQVLMPNFRTSLNSEAQLEDFLRHENDTLKVLLFNGDEHAPMHFKGITSYYRQRIDFAEIYVPNNTKLSARYNITLNQTHLPRLIALKPPANNGTAPEAIVYNGAMRFDSMRAFLDRFALRERKKHWFSDYEEILPTGVKKLQHAELQSVLDENDQRWIALHLVSKNSAQNKDKDHPVFVRLQKTFGTLFQYYEIDAHGVLAEQEFLEDLLHLRTWPSLLIYPFGKKSLRGYLAVAASETDESLATELLDFVEIRERLIDDGNIRPFIADAIREERYGFVWFYSTKDPINQLIVHTLSNIDKFKRYLKFARYPDPDHNSEKVWDLPRVPYAIALLGEEDGGKQQKKGKPGLKRSELPNEFNFQNCWDYVSQLSLQREKEEILNKAVREANTWESFNEACLLSGKPCMIAFLDPSRKKEQFDLDLDNFNKLRENFLDREIAWLWVDAVCHQEMARKLLLSTENLPILIYYDHAKDRYKAMNDEAFTVRNMILFTQNLEKRKRGFVTLEEELDMDERDCAKAHQEARSKRKTDL